MTSDARSIVSRMLTLLNVRRAAWHGISMVHNQPNRFKHLTDGCRMESRFEKLA
jgi:hypothetical protein